MRLLFTLDSGGYDPEGKTFVRPSARGILIRQGRVAMVYSQKYQYYKFPGGGVHPGETLTDALIREVREEAGLVVLPQTIREFGWVHRVEKWTAEARLAQDNDSRLVQDNYYFLCGARPEPTSQRLDGYEAEEGFTLRWAEPRTAIAVNRDPGHGPKKRTMLEREARVLELLIREGWLAAD